MNNVGITKSINIQEIAYLIKSYINLYLTYFDKEKLDNTIV